MTPGPMRGSSPLARGLRQTHRPAPDLFRIIPARAGFTSRIFVRSRRMKDHPSSRGVYLTARVFEPVSVGSSPLARGLLTLIFGGRIAAVDHPRSRGVYSIRRSTTWTAPDHPRSRGVYVPDIWLKTRTGGSSPLARGLPKRSILASSPGRIIPARAGFTGGAEVGPGGESDHPRSRGVYPRSPQITLSAPGSSPLARGLLP